MQLSAQIESQAIVKAINAFQDEVRWAPSKTIRFQGKPAMQKVAEFTPPKTLSQGRKAVARDIKRAVLPLRPNDFTNEKIKKAIKAKDYQGLTQSLRAAGWGRLEKVVPFSPEAHTSQRNRRGRVPNRNGVRFATPDVQELNAYIRTVQGRVGIAKGGWASSIIQLGGKPAGWVSRWSGQGSVDDSTQSIAPSFTSTNKSPWTAQGDEDRIIDAALKSRTTSIYSDLENRIAKAAKKAGLN